MRLKSKFNGVISASEWHLDSADLVRVINPKTKAILINSPHNPTGKIYSVSELEKILRVAQQHNLLIISDEVVS